MERSYKFFFIIGLVFISFLSFISKSQCQYGFPYSSYGGYWQPQYYQPYPNFPNWMIGPTGNFMYGINPFFNAIYYDPITGVASMP